MNFDIEVKKNININFFINNFIMLYYTKNINLYLFVILALFLNICSAPSNSHEIKPSIGDFTYDDNFLNFKIRLN